MTEQEIRQAMSLDLYPLVIDTNSHNEYVVEAYTRIMCKDGEWCDGVICSDYTTKRQYSYPLTMMAHFRYHSQVLI